MEFSTDRRALLGGAGLSLAGVVALAGVASAAPAVRAHRAGASQNAAAQDAALLNAAIALEHEGIAAYEIALGSGLIPAKAVNLVKTFQGHHSQHRDELAAAVKRLGGKPVDAKTMPEYVKDLNAAAITSLMDIQRLALRLEKGAASAYLGLIAPLNNTEFHEVVARLAADEAAHAAVFMGDLGEPFPERAHIFG